MLSNKVIIYDDSCPMCKLYTYWFVAWGFLDSQNRIGFATAPKDVIAHVDLDRGRHEIPLYDRETKETLYGLHALTHILESKWSLLRPIFRLRLFWLTFYPLYQIVTFNRRVIAGCKHCSGFDCAPDLNRFYRSVYLLIVVTIGAAAIVCLAVAGGFVGTVANSLLLGFAGGSGLITAIKRIAEGRLPAWNYAGNSATIMIIVAALCLPAIVLPTAAAWVVLFAAGTIGVSEMIRRNG